jgi:hypothetical protein
MAIYTTFFLCPPEELPGGFPGWQLPLAKPVRRTFRNPFTCEESVVETREPEWPGDAGDESERGYHVVEIEGSYEDYLEGRLPPFVRSCPHWAANGLTEVELAPLIEAAGVTGSIECAIYSPPSSVAVVQQLPAGFLAKRGSLDQKAVAKRWAAAMSMPEHTRSVTGVKLSSGWIASEAEAILKHLVALSRRASAGQQLYLLAEA